MTLRLNGDNSGFTEIKAADTAGDNSIKLPASNGSANQLLQNGGTAGELQYTSAGGGLHYDSSGRLLVGTSSGRNVGGGANAIIQAETTSENAISFVAHRGTNTSGSILVLAKSRGTAAGSSTIVADDDELGAIRFAGADGTDVETRAASIAAFVDGTPGTDVMPGKLIFSTNAGGANVTPRIEIGSNGALKLLAGCPGIDFSGIQTNNAGMTSETLDSYEEGTWTPVGANNFNGITNAEGTYVKVGKIVWVGFQFNYSSLDSSTDQSFISGLPFAPANNNSNTGVEATGICFGSNKYLIMYAEALTLSFDTRNPFYGSASTGADFFRGSIVYST